MDLKGVTNSFNKLYFEVVDTLRNNVVQMLTTAVANGKLAIDRKDIPTVVNFLTNTINDSKLQLHRRFDQEAKRLVQSVVDGVEAGNKTAKR
jgi:hypothetical protein